MERKYLKRYMDDDLERYLRMIGAVLIVGPKWCGKTTTAERHAKSVIKLQDPKRKETYKIWAEFDPNRLLEGNKPKLIDEWQMAPILWDAVRNSVDEIGGEGLYILTGSTVVDESKIMHSGTGRIHRVLMRPMSLYESLESNGKISLMELFDNPNLDINGITSDLTIDKLIFAACRGGWPESVVKKDKEAQLFVAKSYVQNICNTDISAIDGVKRNPDKVRSLLKSLARNNSTLVNDKTIMADINVNEKISNGTYYSYIKALKDLFVIEEIKGWSPDIKSKTSMRSRNKKIFIDPSIAIASLKMSPESCADDLLLFGFLFENLCIRDLNIYTSPLDGNIYYYHDKSDIEIDCVVHLNDNRYALIECKLGSEKIDEGAKNLLKINKLIEKNDKLNNPSFLAILTGGEVAYTRPDGVKVIPIGCLKQ